MLEGVFRFWGYAPTLYRRLCFGDEAVFRDQSQNGEIRFGYIQLKAELGPLVRDYYEPLADGLNAYVAVSDTALDIGEKQSLIDFQESGGRRYSLLSRDRQGWLWFHFNIDRTISYVEQEDYNVSAAPFYSRLGLRPDRFSSGLRRYVAGGFAGSRQLLKKLSWPTNFPAEDKDFSVDLWRFLVRGLVEQQSDTACIEPLWPENKTHVVILSHDVDTAWGINAVNGISAFCRIEEELELRSSWMVVGGLFAGGERCFQTLLESGHEIGLHDILHDHRIAYLSPESIRRRIRQASGIIRRFECRGFRSPAHHQSQALFAGLDESFSYDMSSHDVHEDPTRPWPRRTGCSTCFPFRRDKLSIVEIPTTVTEDYVLEEAGYTPRQALAKQLELVAAIARRQGVASILTHPEPGLSARHDWLQCYRELLLQLRQSNHAWFVLPGQLYDWWTEREDRINTMWSGSKY